MNYTDAQIWAIIAIMGVGTFLIRYSFLGIIGDRELPPWVLRHLRYTSVAILPGLVAPLVLWPQATNGDVDPARLLAALTTLAVGYFFKVTVRAMLCGAVVLYSVQFVLG